jgi:hypothetical protein
VVVGDRVGVVVSVHVLDGVTENTGDMVNVLEIVGETVTVLVGVTVVDGLAVGVPNAVNGENMRPKLE